MPKAGEVFRIAFDCELHGTSSVNVVMGYTGNMIGNRCVACEREGIEAAERKEQEAKVRREIESRASIIEKLLARSGIPERFRTKSFDNFRAEETMPARNRAICLAYAAEFPMKSARGSGMILCGNAGTGKTHLACALVDDVIRRHLRSAAFVRVSKAIRTVKQTYSKSSDLTEQQAIESFVRPDLLVLDEVGVQFGSDAEKYILFEIINERYEAMKPTILVSNLAIAGLSEFVGDRVVDRMRENGGALLVFDWQSMRER